jgi:hypothetical protein
MRVAQEGEQMDFLSISGQELDARNGILGSDLTEELYRVIKAHEPRRNLGFRNMSESVFEYHWTNVMQRLRI